MAGKKGKGKPTHRREPGGVTVPGLLVVGAVAAPAFTTGGTGYSAASGVLLLTSDPKTAIADMGYNLKGNLKASVVPVALLGGGALVLRKAPRVLKMAVPKAWRRRLFGGSR